MVGGWVQAKSAASIRSVGMVVGGRLFVIREDAVHDQGESGTDGWAASEKLGDEQQ